MIYQPRVPSPDLVAARAEKAEMQAPEVVPAAAAVAVVYPMTITVKGALEGATVAAICTGAIRAIAASVAVGV